MADKTGTIEVSDGSELACLLERMGTGPLRLARNGVIYRVTREADSRQEYDPEKVRAAVRATAGSWADLDTDAMIEALYRAREEGSRPAHRP